MTRGAGRRFTRGWGALPLRRWGLAALGAVLGVLILHPVTMVIYWFEFHPTTGAGGLWQWVVERAGMAMLVPMATMSALFAAVGAAAGLVFGAASDALARRDQAIRELRSELEEDVASLIRCGESERVEFKASARWDFRETRVNRKLELAVVRTIAGFLNNRGGNLILGVNDGAAPIGLEHDYRTLRRPDRDGYEAFLMGLIQRQFGGDVCPRIHFLFRQLPEGEVCRVLVEPGRRPAFIEDGGATRFYLRTGNATRELDVRETVRHVARRWPGTGTIG